MFLEADPNWAGAAPFRDHVRQLLADTGIDYRFYAALAEVSPTAIRRLLTGARPVIHVELARAILACDIDDITNAEATRIPAEPSRRLLAALVSLGWTRTDLLRYLPSRDVALLGSHALYCTRATAARISAFHDYAVRPRRPQPRSGSTTTRSPGHLGPLNMSALSAALEAS